MFSQKCIPTQKFAVLGAHRNTIPAVWYDRCVTKCAVVKALKARHFVQDIIACFAPADCHLKSNFISCLRGKSQYSEQYRKLPFLFLSSPSSLIYPLCYSSEERNPHLTRRINSIKFSRRRNTHSGGAQCCGKFRPSRLFARAREYARELSAGENEARERHARKVTRETFNRTRDNGVDEIRARVGALNEKKFVSFKVPTLNETRGARIWWPN